MTRSSVVAIDGPVASGKTVVGRSVAQRLGYRFLDTGIMYRALTWAVLRASIKPKDKSKVARLARKSAMELTFHPGGQVSVVIDGIDATHHLREREVEEAVSAVSGIREVREVLVEQQRELAADGRMVMAGRDIGTVVLHDAPSKVFLTASIGERSRRRFDELQRDGSATALEEVQKDLEHRDKLDSDRKASPLRPARDAQVLVTDGMTTEQVTDFILSIVRGR